MKGVTGGGIYGW